MLSEICSFHDLPFRQAFQEMKVFGIMGDCVAQWWSPCLECKMLQVLYSALAEGKRGGDWDGYH